MVVVAGVGGENRHDIMHGGAPHLFFLALLLARAKKKGGTKTQRFLSQLPNGFQHLTIGRSRTQQADNNLEW